MDNSTMHSPRFTPQQLAAMMGQKFAPTAQQAAVISHPMEPALVVAGAGAGKTETMAARVVWLVANGYVRPEQVLGLTFSRKAARELGTRIRQRLVSLANAQEFRRQADPEVLASLEVIAPTVATYDSFGGNLLKEYGLLVPTEPNMEYFDSAREFQIAMDLVAESSIASKQKPEKLAALLIKLNAEIAANMFDVQEAIEQTKSLIHLISQLPPGKRQQSAMNKELLKIIDTQNERLNVLPLIEPLRQRYAQLGGSTFAMRLAEAAVMVSKYPHIGQAQRQRFKVILLDEYQDTSHSQRVLLRDLFAGNAVTAVGDPMQSIYGWRGATEENLKQFTTDFPQSNGEEAPKLQLLTSWRNPEKVLHLANQVAEKAFVGTQRTVEALEPREGAGTGELLASYFATEVDEFTWIAEEFASRIAEAKEQGNEITAAVLLRRNSQAAEVQKALTAKGIPSEIVASEGLLLTPEIQDVTAVLRLLQDPGDNEAALRVLTSPYVNLGRRDLEALTRRVKQLNRSVQQKRVFSASTDQSVAALREALEERLDQIVTNYLEQHFGLGHAIADPAITDPAVADPTVADSAVADSAVTGGEVSSATNYSSVGAQRIQELAAKLGFLRRWSLTKALPELIADVEKIFGIRIQAQIDSYQDGHAGLVNLDRFTQVVADYAKANGSDLKRFLGYLEYAKDSERGLSRDPVHRRGNVVQILTVHKAKGLEWDLVAVPGADAKTAGEVIKGLATESYLTSVHQIPTEINGVPELDFGAMEDQTEANKAIKAFKESLRVFTAAESRRVFYVAITRSADTLLLSANADYDPGWRTDPAARKTNPKQPSEFLVRSVKSSAAEVGYWLNPEAEGIVPAPSPADRILLSDSSVGDAATMTATTLESVSEELVWPTKRAIHGDEKSIALAQAVLQAMQEQENGETLDPIPGDISTTWDTETSLLVNEYRDRLTEAIEVQPPTSLSASEYISLQHDPAGFARRKLRPVPFKPNAYARRGTTFHNWLEQRFGDPLLLDDEELFSIADEFSTELPELAAEASALQATEEVEALKQAFLDSEWADRKPVAVELPFEVSIGQHRVVGRIDAVFQIDGQWWVVDWKSGWAPRDLKGKDMQYRSLQLALYRIALADQLASGQLGSEADAGVAVSDINAAFVFLGGGARTVQPAEEFLPNRIELEALLDAASRSENA